MAFRRFPRRACRPVRGPPRASRSDPDLCSCSAIPVAPDPGPRPRGTLGCRPVDPRSVSWASRPKQGPRQIPQPRPPEQRALIRPRHQARRHGDPNRFHHRCSSLGSVRHNNASGPRSASREQCPPSYWKRLTPRFSSWSPLMLGRLPLGRSPASLTATIMDRSWAGVFSHYFTSVCRNEELRVSWRRCESRVCLMRGEMGCGAS